MGCPQVCAGATLQCSFGAAPTVLNVLPQNRTLTSGMPAANIMDHIPLLNIPTFGLCQSPANPVVAAATAAALGVLTPMPCIPATARAGRQWLADLHLGRGDQDQRAGTGAAADSLSAAWPMRA